MNWKHPSIIAIKGHPFTGKSYIAWDLACHLRYCLLISLDEILDGISGDTARPPSAEAAEQLTAQAFDILCGFVEKQLRLGVSVIIDYLPPSRPHLDRLAALSKFLNATKFVVVECRIEHVYAWRMRFEEAHKTGNRPWYKPKDWDEVTELVSKLLARDERKFEEHVDGVSRVILRVDLPVRGRHIIQAIQSLVYCQDDRHLDYAKWNGSKPDNTHSHDHEDAKDRNQARFCRDGHSISVFKEEEVAGYEANCVVCETPVLGASYACDSCRLTIHKSCASASSNKTFTPLDFPTFITTDPPAAYSFPENYPCIHCKEAGREYSAECSSCIYECLLKNRLVPTVINHGGHNHTLYLWAMKIKNEGAYKCSACGKDGAYVAYGCHTCDLNYHLECALLPYPIQDHNHGGYKHPLDLVFMREDKDVDDFPCDHCFEMMNPEDWYYHCRPCNQTYHLNCSFFSDGA